MCILVFNSVRALVGNAYSLAGNPDTLGCTLHDTQSSLFFTHSSLAAATPSSCVFSVSAQLLPQLGVTGLLLYVGSQPSAPRAAEILSCSRNFLPPCVVTGCGT